jgi:hypothetical protein
VTAYTKKFPSANMKRQKLGSMRCFVVTSNKLAGVDRAVLNR